MRRVSLTLLGFLAAAFAVVGLAGVFATYAAPLPLARALAREAAFDTALQAVQTGDPTAALATLAARLGEGVPDLHPGPDLAARLVLERQASRAELSAQAQAIQQQLRLLIIVITVAGAAFGAAIMGSTARKGASGAPMPGRGPPI